MADTALRGASFCRKLSDVTDSWLSEIAAEAVAGAPRRIALLAVGGYGRQELCPYSDLDLLLVHEGRRDIKQVADRLWYPVWDEGIRIDHAVRRPKEVLKTASGDLRVALGLLDARLIWGDPKLIDPVVEKVGQLWRSELASAFLPALEEQMADRHRDQGDVAFLLEPNLKEAHGGLRDVSVLRALASCSPKLEELVDLDAISSAADTLTAVRVELHRSSGRALDRMLLQEQDQIAAALSYDDADALCSAVSEAGRSIAWLSDEIWRRRRLWAPGAAARPVDDAPERDVVEEGIVIVNGEVTLSPSAAVTTDCSLIWRSAAVSAERDLPLSLGAIHRLADLSPAPPDPWDDRLRDSLVRLLLAGRRAIAAFESLDHLGLVSHLMPEWEHVRHHHQRNAYHRYTVDRHLLEAAANAAELADQVDRPDLLVIGGLLHDIGKGLPGDHTVLGIEIVGNMAPRMGFSPPDVAILQSLVRHHLLLADTATRRDLGDPKTIETVAEQVGDLTTLRLLGALTKADSLATGPSAWGSWKEQLVDELVRRTEEFLEGAALPAREHHVAGEHEDLVAEVRSTGRPGVLLEPPQVVVVAPDRPGLLAAVAGTIALHGLDVHAADAESFDDVAVEVFTVETSSGRWPDSAVLRGDLDDVFADRVDLELLLARRAESYAGAKRAWSAHPIISSVSFDNDASSDCTVVEVRAPDEIGLLHRLCSTLFEAGLDVVAARVATIGGEVVDAFYVRAPDGQKLHDQTAIAAVTEAVEAALAS